MCIYFHFDNVRTIDYHSNILNEATTLTDNTPFSDHRFTPRVRRRKTVQLKAMQVNGWPRCGLCGCLGKPGREHSNSKNQQQDYGMGKHLTFNKVLKYNHEN